MNKFKSQTVVVNPQQNTYMPVYTKTGLRVRLIALTGITATFLIWAMQETVEAQIKGTPLYKGTMF